MTTRNSYPIIIKDEKAVIGAVRASIEKTMNDGYLESGEARAAFDASYDQLVFDPLNEGMDVGNGLITIECVMLYGAYIYLLLKSRVEFDPDTTEAYDDEDQPVYVFTIRMLSAETDEDQAVEVMSTCAAELEFTQPDWTMLEVR